MKVAVFDETGKAVRLVSSSRAWTVWGNIFDLTAPASARILDETPWADVQVLQVARVEAGAVVLADTLPTLAEFDAAAAHD